MSTAKDQEAVVCEQIFGEVPNRGVGDNEWATAPETTTVPSG